MQATKFVRSAIAGAALTLVLAGPAWTANAIPVTVTVNAKQEASLPGKFIWFDGVTDDAAASEAFYGAVFGWTFQGVGTGEHRYTLIRNRDRNIGGLLVRPRDAGATRGARWIVLMSVADPVRAASFVEAQGGKVLVPPVRFAGRGTHALFRDSEGALFGVLNSETGDPPDGPLVPGNFVWVDLFARDAARAGAFYRGLAGFDVSPTTVAPGITRLVLASAGIPRAAIVAMPKESADTGWLAFVEVEDVAATSAKVAAAGGRVLVAPRSDLLRGHGAIIADPLGGIVGIVNGRKAVAAATAPAMAAAPATATGTATAGAPAREPAK
jgi:hypothetical protein